jgi:hypothetical protein
MALSVSDIFIVSFLSFFFFLSQHNIFSPFFPQNGNKNENEKGRRRKNYN